MSHNIPWFNQGIQAVPYQNLIQPLDLNALLNDQSSNVKLLDASCVLPSSPINPRAEFDKAHIKGAQFFDIDDIADHTTDLPHMLPSADDFENSVSALGISNADTIVIYGQGGIIMGPARAWWMFRAFGHDNVCILDGGLPAWKDEGGNITDTPTPPERVRFKATKNSTLVFNISEVREQIGHALIMDARPPARFEGKVPEPRAELKMGNIPTSINIPAGSLINDKQKLKNKETLEGIFAPYSINKKTTLIATCGSGITACVIAFALFNIGIKNVKIYDGSWAEWGQQ